MAISFHELAERELNDAAQYYEHEQSGLGAAFIADVRQCTDAIVEHPEAGPVILGRVRRRLCRRTLPRITGPASGCSTMASVHCRTSAMNAAPRPDCSCS